MGHHVFTSFLGYNLSHGRNIHTYLFLLRVGPSSSAPVIRRAPTPFPFLAV